MKTLISALIAFSVIGSGAAFANTQHAEAKDNHEVASTNNTYASGLKDADIAALFADKND